MDILYFAALILLVVALVERNHRHNLRLPHAPWGATDDRDLDRVRHDLGAVDPKDPHPLLGGQVPRGVSTPAVTRQGAAAC